MAKRGGGKKGYVGTKSGNVVPKSNMKKGHKRGFISRKVAKS